jgi:hypothetical protein
MIIFDLDGTLADCEHRRHFVDPQNAFNTEWWNLPEYKDIQITKDKPLKWKPDWKSFYEACGKDTPIWPVVKVIESLGLNDVTLNNKEIQIWSGRCESVRDKTQHWLKYIIGNSTYSRLKMRPIGDNTPDEILKEIWLDEAIAEGKTIDFVFSSRKKVIKMYRGRGIFVFDCNQTGQEF